MSDKTKSININILMILFNDIIDIQTFDLNNIKIDEKWYKNILIHYIQYVIIKEYVKIFSVNPSTLFSDKWIDALKKLMEINI